MSEPQLPQPHQSRNVWGTILLNWLAWLRDVAEFAASRITFDGTSSGLVSTDVQAAIEELKTDVDSVGSNIATDIDALRMESQADATAKASAAQDAAIDAAALDATTKADAAEGEAISAASTDATNKSAAVQSAAETYSDEGIAQHYTDVHLNYYKRLSPAPLNHYANNIPNKIMRGVFTPTKDRVRVVFGASGYTRGITQFYFDLAWKQAPGWTAGNAFDVHNVSSYESLEPNLVSVGSIIAPGSTHREIIISGLTPNQPVSYEIYLNDATYSNNYPTGASPKFLAVLDKLQGGSVFSSERYVASIRTTVVDTVKVPISFPERERSSIVASITLPSTGWYERFSPDGTTLAVVSFAGTQGYVTFIDTTTWTITRTVTMAANKAFVTGTFTSDSLKFWVAETTTHLIYPITVSSGAIGSSVSVLSQPVLLKRRPGTNDIYVVNSTSQGLQVVDGATGTVKSTLALGGTTPALLTFLPDGTKAYVALLGPGVLKEVDLTGAAPALSGRSVSFSTTAKSVQATTDGKALVGVSGSQYWFWDVLNLVQYDINSAGSTTVADLQMGNDGGVYISNTNENRIFCWPGGNLYINDELDTGVRANWCDLMVYGAVAGPND